MEPAASAQSAANQATAWVYDNANNAVPGMKYPLGHVTTATSFWGGAAYVTQAAGFSVFGTSVGETQTISGAEGSVLGTSYLFQHSYTAILGLPLKDAYPAAGGLPYEVVTHTYIGGLEYPTGIGGLSAYAENVAYDEFGRVKQETIGAAANLAYLTDAYDVHTGNLTDQKLTRAVATPTDVDDETYSYDPAGNITQQTDTRLGSTASSETQCYTYDQVRRLTTAWTATDSCAAIPTPASHANVGDGLGAASTYWTTWTFNALGERTTQTQHGLSGAADTTTTSAYNGNGASQPTTLTSTSTAGPGSGTTAYTYDAAGNMTSRNATQGNQTLTWNPASQLTSLTTATSTSSYEYGPSGGLLIQKDPGTVTLSRPGEQITLNTATNAATGVRYYTLPGGGIAYRTGTATTAYGFEITDPHGTPTLALDNTAQIPTWRQTTPYGAPRGNAPAWPDNRTFLNKPTDTSTGLTNIGARYYDPTTATFTSLDPVLDTSHPQTLNGYSYSAGNPVTFSDPSGLEAGSWCTDTACAILNGQSQTSYPMDTLRNGRTHHRPAPNISPDVYAQAVIETYAHDQLAPGPDGVYHPANPIGSAQKMYLAARAAYIAAHSGGGLHTMPVPNYLPGPHAPLSAVLAAASTVTGGLAFGLTVTVVGAPAGGALEAASVGLDAAAVALETTSLVTLSGATLLDCSQELMSSGCGLDAATLAVGGGGSAVVWKLGRRIVPGMAEGDRALAEMQKGYTDVGKSNMELGLTVGGYANAASSFFNEGNDPSASSGMVQDLGYGAFLTWQ